MQWPKEIKGHNDILWNDNFDSDGQQFHRYQQN
jgi:hypothetical protein